MHEKRRPDPSLQNEQDKRNVDVELTEQGEKAEIEAIRNRQAYFSTMPQRKKQQLAGLLEALLQTWEVPINGEEYQYCNTEE